MNQKDTGTTELIGFMMIFALVIAAIGIVTAVYFPIFIGESEVTQNDEALEAFLTLNTDITTLCLAEVKGMSRRNLLTAGTLFQDVGLSLTHDKTIAGYRELVISYRCENAVAEDLSLSLSHKGVRKNTKALITPTVYLVVNPDDTTEQMESDAGVFWIETTYLGTFAEHGKTYHIVSVRIT